jgi:glycosyltransferase involved in cell wall biosynthesis
MPTCLAERRPPEPRVKILHVQKVAGIGGSERHLQLLLPALAARGLDVQMCVLGADASSIFVDRLRADGMSVIATPAGPDLNPRVVAWLVGQIRRCSPDLVHTHLIHADLYGQLAARIKGVPAVSSVHAAHSFYGREPYRSATRLAGRLAARTIAISNHVAKTLLEARTAPAERIEVVHYGIDASEWAADDQRKAEARQRFGMGRDEVVVGVASRLVPHKGHDFLLRGMAEAVRREPRLRLAIAGSGPLEGDLRALAQQVVPEGHVRFLGFVDDISSFMQACDVIAFPTLPEFGEGFGLAALEAMAAGRPVVATAVASLPEVVADGESGILVAPGVVADLGAALVRLAQDVDLRRELGVGAHRRATTQFSLEKMVDRTAAIYGEVLEERKG